MIEERCKNVGFKYNQFHNIHEKGQNMWGCGGVKGGGTHTQQKGDRKKRGFHHALRFLSLEIMVLNPKGGGLITYHPNRIEKIIFQNAEKWGGRKENGKQKEKRGKHRGKSNGGEHYLQGYQWGVKEQNFQGKITIYHQGGGDKTQGRTGRGDNIFIIY